MCVACVVRMCTYGCRKMLLTQKRAIVIGKYLSMWHGLSFSFNSYLPYSCSTVVKKGVESGNLQHVQYVDVNGKTVSLFYTKGLNQALVSQEVALKALTYK